MGWSTTGRSATLSAVLVVLVVVLTTSALAALPRTATASPTLTISVTTTVGDERVTAIAPEQSVELRVAWSGFQSGDQDLQIRVTQSDVPSIRTRTETVTGESGSATFRLDDILPPDGFDGTRAIDLTVSAPGAGPNEEGASASVDLIKAPTTLYLTDVPSRVRADETVTVSYYG